METPYSRDLSPVTYYRPPDPKSSFRICADQHALHMRNLGVKVEECDLDFSPESLSGRSPAGPVAIIHPLFLFRNWHGISFAEILENLARRHRVLLGMEVADSDRISPHFAQWANHPAVAGIMLPSSYSCQSFRKSGVATPLYRVSHGVMTEAPTARFAYLREYGRPIVLFFATRDPHRKGWDLLRAVMPEFPSCLFVVKASGQGEKYFDQCPNAVILREWLSPADLASLYTFSDLFISLHRGGAFELHCAEALGYGLPVVATRYGCVLDYLNDTNSWLVDFAGDVRVYPPGDDHCGTGASADTADACRKIREILADPAAAKRRAGAAMVAARRNLSWLRVTKRLIACARLAVRPARAGGACD